MSKNNCDSAVFSSLIIFFNNKIETDSFWNDVFYVYAKFFYDSYEVNESPIFTMAERFHVIKIKRIK